MSIPSNLDNRFNNKVIVITGAGGNFGREGCIYFATRGAKIGALDLSPTALSETIDAVKEKLKDDNTIPWSDDLIIGLECDVTDANSVKDTIMKIYTKYQTIDLLWNNAGYQGQIKPTLEYDPKDFAMVMSINVTGMFIVLQAVAKVMTSEYEKDNTKHFSIVNTSSVAGLRGTPAMVAYSSSKAAVLAMTVSTSKDLAPFHIRVNSVSPALIGPGYMWTRQNELHAKSGSPYFSTDPDAVASSKVNSVPMKRLGSILEVIQSVAFLLSEESSYTTATNLVVDGGMSGGLKA